MGKIKYTTEIRSKIVGDYLQGIPVDALLISNRVSETSFDRILREEGIKRNRQDVKVLNPLTIEQICYIAGIVDGEGCITITKRADRDYRNGFSFMPNLRVVNTSKNLIDWLLDVTKLGSILYRPSDDGIRKDVWEWKVATKQSVQIVEKTLPFLVIKKRQAEILLEVNDLRKDNFGQFGRGGVPREIWEKQFVLYQEIRELNKRGKLQNPVS